MAEASSGEPTLTDFCRHLDHCTGWQPVTARGAQVGRRYDGPCSCGLDSALRNFKRIFTAMEHKITQVEQILANATLLMMELPEEMFPAEAKEKLLTEVAALKRPPA